MLVSPSMQLARRLHRYTYADYVALELMSPTKHEFFDGEIYAMAGGSEDHSALALEVLYAFRRALGDRPCRVHTSDLRVYVEATGFATFPDGSVVCGPLEQHSASPRATALNPLVLLEVTSDSSEEYDNGLKVGAYRAIPSLRDYVIVSHRQRRITVHQRQDDGRWETRTATTGEAAPVKSLGADLNVDEVYRQSRVV